MKRTHVILGAAVGALLCYGSAVHANVIDSNADKTLKPAAKLRSDIAAQVAKYTLCLVKAEAACEKGGSSSAAECHLGTGVVDFEPSGGKYTTKFQSAVGKCDTKLNLIKHGFTGDYVAVGCPGDCNAGAPGTQECADLTAFQSNATATTKAQLPVLAAVIDAQCGVDTGAPQTDPARIDCVTNSAKGLSKYAQGLFKCEQKCEVDFKNKIGNGGADNSNVCSTAGSDVAFQACNTAALGKAGALSPHIQSVVVPILQKVIDNATSGLFDRADPTGSASDTPCGNCGNGVREGAESCDGSDLGICATCKSDCTCG